MKSIKALPEVGAELAVPISIPTPLPITEEVEGDEWDMPVFAFHDLDYVPSGYGGILAPYIETGPGTMRAAATLMGLDPHTSRETSDETQRQQIICDLGCGDGEFLIGLLAHVNKSRFSTSSPLISTPPLLTAQLLLPAQGLGIDYNGPLIATATHNAISAHQIASWLVYDFNLDADDLLSNLVQRGVTHVFVYLVPKQLALGSVKAILIGLWDAGVVVCAHKFIPEYLGVGKSDLVMDLCVFEKF